jgi:glycosyltransferase involved in cell wall biosynthesis
MAYVRSISETPHLSSEVPHLSQAPWVLVAAGFHRNGGMDRCNLALARYLAGRGDRVGLVCHDADPHFIRQSGVTAHLVAKPAGSFMLGEQLLARRGREIARKITARWPQARVVVNGGNCDWPDINWVHYVHHAWRGQDSSPAPWLKAKDRIARWIFARKERTALCRARILFANSDRTRQDVINHLGVNPARIHTVYLGSDPDFSPPTAPQRAAARAWLSQPECRPLVAFVGFLGYDSRKGHDVLFSAWRKLCARPEWDADLVVAGGGRALDFWRRQVAASGLDGRIKMLGFTDRIPDVLAAADLLVSPTRYEAYGLNVHEAICCDVPAMVTETAGVAERYPAEVRELLIRDPEHEEELAAMILRWRSAMSHWKQRVLSFSQILRRHTLDAMAREIVAIAESNSGDTLYRSISV